jgi:hypothetical protein
MGTSKGYGGARTGLVPSWVDDPPTGSCAGSTIPCTYAGRTESRSAWSTRACSATATTPAGHIRRRHARWRARRLLRLCRYREPERTRRRPIELCEKRYREPERTRRRPIELCEKRYRWRTTSGQPHGCIKGLGRSSPRRRARHSAIGAGRNAPSPRSGRTGRSTGCRRVPGHAGVRLSARWCCRRGHRQASDVGNYW